MADSNMTAIPREVYIDENNNAFFLLVMGVMIFLMQCGFGFLEAGCVRSKNTTNILIKNLLDSCISAICYWIFGYGFAFGQPSNPFLGTGQFLLINLPDNLYAKWFFQFVFCATASTIVSGALAERCEFVAYFAYCGFLTSFVYPVVTHWAWDDNGWLHNGPNDLSFHDFAGSGVVHVLGGISAFFGAYFLGPRIGRFAKKTEANTLQIQGHSVPFAALGGFILMFGFFAFNGGSQASISQPGDGAVIAKAMVITMLSGGFAALTSLGFNKLFGGKKWSLLKSINSVLTGMVAACAGCNVIEPWAGALTGIGAGLMYELISFSVDKIRVDDPLDAVAVHFGGGSWGLISTPILMKGGILYTFSRQSFLIFAWNLLGWLVIAVWSGGLMGLLFFTLNKFNRLRVPAEIEIKGLDIYKHGEPAYPVSAYGHGWDIQNDPKPRQHKMSFFFKRVEPRKSVIPDDFKTTHDKHLPFIMEEPNSELDKGQENMAMETLDDEVIKGSKRRFINNKEVPV